MLPKLTMGVGGNYPLSLLRINSLQRCGLSRQRPAKQYKSRHELKVMAFEEELEKN